MKDLWNEAKEHPWITVGIFIGIPVLVYFLSELQVFPVGGSNDWAGFWGGYLGSIIGGIITLYVMKKTIENENADRRRDEKIEFFDSLTKLSAEMSATIGDLCICISRDRSENNNDLHEKSFTISNSVARLAIEIAILLDTRCAVYKVDELSAVLSELSSVETALVNRYEDAIKVRFLNKTMNKEIEQMEDQLEKLSNTFIEQLKVIIKNDLFTEG